MEFLCKYCAETRVKFFRNWRRFERISTYIYIYTYITLYAIGCERNSFLKDKLEPFFQRSPPGKMFLVTISFFLFHCSRSQYSYFEMAYNKIGEKRAQLNWMFVNNFSYSLLNRALSESSSNWKIELRLLITVNTINHRLLFKKFYFQSIFIRNKKNVLVSVNNRYYKNAKRVH